MPETTDLETALAAARDGAEWAWAVIYREMAPAIGGYLRARGAAEPDDLVGEVMLQIVRDLERFEGSARDFRAWAFSIAHNRMLDEGRRRTRRPVDPVPAQELEGPPGPDTASAEALARLGGEEVRALIGRLSSDQRAVVLLRVLGDLSIEEVARVTGKRPGAVKQLQRRGLAAIRKQIGPNP